MSDPSFSVVIGTYGDSEWKEKAERAIASVKRQTVPPASIHHVHGETLAKARNQGVEEASGSHVICLDADDELDEGYIEAMLDSVTNREQLLQPSTLGVVDGVEDPHPVLIPQRPLHTGNFMVIGTGVRRDFFLNLGGFQEYPMYEDWEAWIRCWKAGAEFTPVEAAVYRVHVNPKGRNSADAKEQTKWFNEIRRVHFPSK